MKDRIVEYPNRYIDQNGNILILTPSPGTITEQGTPVNKASLLSDTTAEMFGLNNSATPNDCFGRISFSRWYGKYIELTGASQSANSLVAFSTLKNDDFNVINLSNYPTRMNVPTGSKKVKLTIRLNQKMYAWNGSYGLYLYKNDATTNITIYGMSNENNAVKEPTQCMCSEIISVVDGDYLQLYAAGSAMPQLEWCRLEVLQ